MPREHKILLYQFSELSKKAKERALRDYRDKGWTWDEADTQMLTEEFEGLLKDKGFDGAEVNWSLGNCQGDGVCFSATVDIKTYLKAFSLTQKFRRLIGHVEAKVSKSRGSCNSNSMSVELEMEENIRELGPKDWAPGKPNGELISEFGKQLESDVESMSKELKKIGYQEIEYKESDEYIIDSIEANEREFTEDGKMWRG